LTAYLKASNTGDGDMFGYTVAISGDTIVVGATWEGSVPGNPADNSKPKAGAAYVFRRTAGAWTPEAILKASNADAGDLFGWGVAVDGDTIVIGAPGEASNATAVNGNQADNSAPEAGAVYVFTRGAGGWSQQAYLKASNAEAGDIFGRCVSISGDTIVVGAIGEDGGYPGVNGTPSDNSCNFAGAAYVFVRSGTTWTQEAYLKASNPGEDDEFGQGVSIDGDTIVVGALLEDSSAVGVDGDSSDNMTLNSGAAYVFVRNSGVWTQQAYLKASNTRMNSQFGCSVSVSGDSLVVGARWEEGGATGVNGNEALAGNPYGGAAYVFTRTTGIWSQQAYLKSNDPNGNSWFGHSVAISGDLVLVGAFEERGGLTGVMAPTVDPTSGPQVLDSGAAFLFSRVGGAWYATAYLKSPNPDPYDQFGCSVGLSGDTMVIGANLECGGGTGVTGSPSDNSVPNSGAAYVYR
jgi:hypothetical protein